MSEVAERYLLEAVFRPRATMVGNTQFSEPPERYRTQTTLLGPFAKAGRSSSGIYISMCPLSHGRSGVTGAPAEDSPGHEAAAARVVVVEEPAH